MPVKMGGMCLTAVWWWHRWHRTTTMFVQSKFENSSVENDASTVLHAPFSRSLFNLCVCNVCTSEKIFHNSLDKMEFMGSEQLQQQQSTR